MLPPRAKHVAIVESLYRLELAPEAWLDLVTGAIRPLTDRYGLGIVGGYYECPDPCSFKARRILVRDVPTSLMSEYSEYLAAPGPDFIAASLLSHRWFRLVDIRGYERIPAYRSGYLRDLGAHDKLSLNAVEPDGSGCWFGSFQSQRFPLSAELQCAFEHVTSHLGAAHRLRRRVATGALTPNEADAVLDPSGRAQHARGRARDRGVRSTLERAARGMDYAKSKRGRADPLAALNGWQAFVAQRWSLVDHFDHDGRRYLLAVDNRPRRTGIELLSGRERQVLLAALGGARPKAIAYELGIAHSTVRVLLRRAKAKIGVRAYAELRSKALTGSLAQPQ